MSEAHASYALDKVFKIPIDKFWEKLSDFENLEMFGITEEQITFPRGERGKVGIVRRFKHPATGHFMEEQLINKNEELKTLSYSMVEVRPPMNTSYMATWKMDKIDEESTRLRWYACVMVDEKDKEVVQKLMDAVPGRFTHVIEEYFKNN